MCGIAGVFYADSQREVDPQQLAAMATAIVHRGPDGGGFFRSPGVGLAHRRLAIIDLEGGKQPLGNEDGSIQVVFNGEIYNYRELAADLQQRGHRFATHSDTEVLVHLYEEMGEHLVEKLRGMFAFALFDGRRQRLLLARDRVGIKPLYFTRDRSQLLFGSELKALLAHEPLPPDLDEESLDSYLTYGIVSGTRTIFRGIEKLAPGHTLTIDAMHWDAAPRRYWQLDWTTDQARTAEDWQEAVRAKVDEAVRHHLVADVPVGAFLSGGIDSSVVTALAAQRGSTLQTFSIGFQEEAFNELPYARAVAAQYHTQHHEEIVTADAAALIDRLCWHFDEPFADASAVPTFLVAQLAARHVKVTLSGDGGDEAFGGYSRYVHDLQETALRNKCPQWLRSQVLGPLGAIWPKADWLPRPLRAKTRLTNLALDGERAYANTLAHCRLPLRHQLLHRDVVERLRGHRPDNMVASAFRAAGDDALAGMIAADIATLLPDDYLVKVDRTSMAVGLEVRPPLLDHELLELTATIPSSLKIRAGETKWIFKHACRDLLPAALHKRPKMGFELPVDQWFRGPLVPLFRETVLSGRSPIADRLNLRRMAALFEQHRTKRGRHGQVLWSLLILCRWSYQFLGAMPASASPLWDAAKAFPSPA